MSRQVLTFIVACIVLARSLLPAGWMLQASPDGAITVVICTEHGARSLILGPDGEPVEEQGGTADPPCAFSKSFHQAIASSAPAISVPAVYVSAGYVGSLDSLVAVPTPTGFTARGPPKSLS